MSKAGKIRVITLGLIKHNNRVFLGEGYDKNKQRTFYRALGGGVDFGETSLEALQREFMEELQAELTNIKYLACLESIFVYKEEPRHEIIQLYQCDFADSRFYELEQVNFNEGEHQKQAMWLDINQCRSGEVRVVPESFIEYL